MTSLCRASHPIDLALEAGAKSSRACSCVQAASFRRTDLNYWVRRFSASMPCLPGRWFARLAILLGLAALTAGCATRGGNIPYAPADFGPPEQTGQAAYEAYDLPLSPLDVIKISVFRVPDLSGDYQIDAHGTVDLPLIGSVNARPFKPDEFARELERQYGQRYLNRPDISVRVMSTNQANVTVEGGVNAPGIYSLPGRTTLVGAIAIARGIKVDDANPKRIAVFRKRGGQTVAAAFDMIAIRHGEMEDPEIYPGDTIIVDYSQTRSIYRDLLQTIPLISVFSRL
jgi:polysaccharide biosynthesis/export protein